VTTVVSNQGLQFINDLEEIRYKTDVIFSFHVISPEVRVIRSLPCGHGQGSRSGIFQPLRR
jgi:hypothetical protein